MCYCLLCIVGVYADQISLSNTVIFYSQMSDEGSVSSEGETLPAISGVSTPSSVVTSNTFQPSASDSQQCFSRKGLVPSRSLVQPSNSPSLLLRLILPILVQFAARDGLEPTILIN